MPHKSGKCTTDPTQNCDSIMDCEEVDIAYISQLSFRRLNPQEIERFEEMGEIARKSERKKRRGSCKSEFQW